jgi:hypothetical protein
VSTRRPAWPYDDYLKLARFFQFVWGRIGEEPGKHGLPKGDVLMNALVACGLAERTEENVVRLRGLGAEDHRVRVGDLVFVPTSIGYNALVAAEHDPS